MKDKSTFRLITIGFLSGIVFSGIVFLFFNIIRNQQQQNSAFYNAQNAIVITEPSTQISVSGKIDLNLATQKELVTLPGIGEAKANAIIDFREKYGAFEDTSELLYVPGIGDTLLKSIQDLVIIN